MKDFFSKLWVEIKHNIVPIIIGALIGYTVVTIGYNRGVRQGYIHGYGDGVDRALDTMSKIVEKQMHNDSDTVTRLTIISPDTLSVVLSNKTLKPDSK